METVHSPTDFFPGAEVAVRFRPAGNIRQTPGIGSSGDLPFIVALQQQSAIQMSEEDDGNIQPLKELIPYGGTRAKPCIFKFIMRNLLETVLKPTKRVLTGAQS